MDALKKSLKLKTMSQLHTGFTLAEVLITLGIIGIVASMTIPALINNANDAQYKSAWKKEFSVLAQAWQRLKLAEGEDVSSYFVGNNSTTPLVKELGDYLAVNKSCNIPFVSDHTKACGISPATDIDYKTLSGGTIPYWNFANGQYLLADGTQLYFRTWEIGYLLVWIDVNGYSKKPNIIGKDVFGITITKDKFIPMGSPGTGVDTVDGCKEAPYSNYLLGSHGGSDYAGVGCAAKYLLE